MLLNPLRNAMSAIKTSLPSPIPSTQFQPFQVGTQRTSSPKVSLLLFAEIFARFLLSRALPITNNLHFVVRTYLSMSGVELWVETNNDIYVLCSNGCSVLILFEVLSLDFPQYLRQTWIILLFSCYYGTRQLIRFSMLVEAYHLLSIR